MPTSSDCGVAFLPNRDSSFHSNITKLTIGSPSASGAVFSNLVRIKGSTDPPQELLLYMPLHFCEFFSSWV